MEIAATDLRTRALRTRALWHAHTNLSFDKRQGVGNLLARQGHCRQNCYILIPVAARRVILRAATSASITASLAPVDL